MSLEKKELKDNKFLFEAFYLKDTEELINNRVACCMEWYIRKACFYKKVFYIGSSIALVCPLIVSIVAGINALTDDISIYCQIIIIVLGGISSAVTGFLALFHANEKWVEYRAAAEYLKKEITLYKAGIGEYQNRESHLVFLNNVEQYMSKENIEWKKISNKIDLNNVHGREE